MKREAPERLVDQEMLDRVVEDTLQAMTDVDAIEARSRVQVLARLAESERASTSLAPRWWSRPVAFRVAALTAASIVAVFAFLVFGRVAIDDRARFTAPPVKQAANDVSRAPQTDPSQTAPPGSAARATAPVARVSPTRERATAPRSAKSRPGQQQRVRAHGAQPADDRLAYVLHAIQQLPADAWERLDAAKPPITPVLQPTGPAPIAPLGVEQLPGADFSVDPSTVTSPGEPR
jgi:hypothetical protein